jgi:uncharacterized protein affecting Mg2+/Co2+ transport
MVSKISEGVEISVETFFQSDYSNPLNGEYMFAYYAATGRFSTAMANTEKWREKVWWVYNPFCSPENITNM